MKRLVWLGFVLGLIGCTRAGDEVEIGSKKFTESVILGEIARALVEQAGARAKHRRELGGSRVLWEALRRGDIDLYPEYTGTLAREILRHEGPLTHAALRQTLRGLGVTLGEPLGFDNTYALGMKEALAARLGITRISDLRQHPSLRYGFTSEFMHRADGWPGLRAHYALRPASVRGLDHDLAYRALDSGSIEVTDVYTTDADIEHYGLRALADDRAYFPSYRAVFLYRTSWVDAHPRIYRHIARLAGQLDAAQMRSLNAQAKVRRVAEARVAAGFLQRQLGLDAAVTESRLLARLSRRTAEHLFLVGVSLAAAILIAIPLGIAAARHRKLGQLVLAAVGLLQTIPSLALLVFMIPLLGIGAPPAMAALFVYSLLPIVRNTHAGLTQIDPKLLEAADALGLPGAARLRLIELPLATASILAGIKTAAVINVGTATLGALIGAGGYGQAILTGIRLDDEKLILEGAIPAALLALAVQGLFEGVERLLVPRGLRC